MRRAAGCIPAGQVDGGLGVSRTGQDAAVLGVEGIDVAGAAEVGGTALGIGEGTDGSGTVVAADPRGAAFEQIDGDGEGRTEHAGVVLHLVGQLEGIAALYGDGGTQDAASFAQHEVHVFGRDEFGSHDEVAFVFAVFVVDDNDEAAFFEVLDGLLNGGQFEWFHV